MSDDKFGGFVWIGDSIGEAIGDALDLDTETILFNAEDFFQQKGILVIKVGNEDRPASEKDIRDVQECLQLAFKDWPQVPFCIVTHHAMDFSILPIEELIKIVKTVGDNEDEN